MPKPSKPKGLKESNKDIRHPNHVNQSGTRKQEPVSIPSNDRGRLGGRSVGRERIREDISERNDGASIDEVPDFSDRSAESETSTEQANDASSRLSALCIATIVINEVTKSQEEEEDGQREENETSSPVALWLPDCDGHDQSEESPQSEVPASSQSIRGDTL